MDWKSYVQSIAKQASQRVGSLFRSQRYLTKEALLYPYNTSIRPCMEYCSHLWSGAAKAGCLDLLDRVQKRMQNLIGVGLAHRLDPLSHRRDVACLSLFYKYYHGHCSQELKGLVPGGRVIVRPTRYSEVLHKFTVNIPTCNGKYYSRSFFPRTATLWNSLPRECFPDGYNLGM